MKCPGQAHLQGQTLHPPSLRAGDTGGPGRSPQRGGHAEMTPCPKTHRGDGCLSPRHAKPMKSCTLNRSCDVGAVLQKLIVQENGTLGSFLDVATHSPSPEPDCSRGSPPHGSWRPCDLPLPSPSHRVGRPHDKGGCRRDTAPPLPRQRRPHVTREAPPLRWDAPGRRV